MAAAATQGIQSKHVVANAKHFILNNQEVNRGDVSVQISERALQEMYMPPFAASVKAGVGSIMCSYNRIGGGTDAGSYSCEHNATLNTDLRDRLGFKGFVMSDWGATHSTSISQGLDQEMPGGDFMGDPLKKRVLSNGTDHIAESTVDRSVTRVLTPFFQVGLFDKPNPNTDDQANVSTAASMTVARELAENSTVLLKNAGGLLPLDAATAQSVLVVGGQAQQPTVGGGGSGQVDPSYLPSPFRSICSRLAQGGGAPSSCQFAPDANDAATIKAAKAADVVLVFVASSSQEGSDRQTLAYGAQVPTYPPLRQLFLEYFPLNVLPYTCLPAYVGRHGGQDRGGAAEDGGGGGGAGGGADAVGRCGGGRAVQYHAGADVR